MKKLSNCIRIFWVSPTSLKCQLKKTLFKKAGFAPHIRPDDPGQHNNYSFFKLKHLLLRADEIQEDLMPKERLTLMYRGVELQLRFEHKFNQEDNIDFLNFYDDEKLVAQIMLKDIYHLVMGANKIFLMVEFFFHEKQYSRLHFLRDLYCTSLKMVFYRRFL